MKKLKFHFSSVLFVVDWLRGLDVDDLELVPDGEVVEMELVLCFFSSDFRGFAGTVTARESDAEEGAAAVDEV